MHANGRRVSRHAFHSTLKSRKEMQLRLAGNRRQACSEQICHRSAQLSFDRPALLQSKAYTGRGTQSSASVRKRRKGDEKRRRQGTGFAPDALNVDAVWNKQHRMAAAPACETARSNVCPSLQYRAEPKTSYNFCGNAPHPRSECPAQWAKCNNKCHKNGHFATVRRSKSTRRLSQVQLCTVD